MADQKDPNTWAGGKRKRRGRLWLFVALLLLLGAGGYLLLAHLSGGRYETFGLPLGGDAALLRGKTLSFWEDLKFKDFDRAATYHAPELQTQVDIPLLVQRVFLIKPELLDIKDFEVVLVDFDSTGLRARVKSRVTVEVLDAGKIREVETMLYYRREGPQAPWYMLFEDSLRGRDPAAGKKH